MHTDTYGMLASATRRRPVMLRVTGQRSSPAPQLVTTGVQTPVDASTLHDTLSCIAHNVRDLRRTTFAMAQTLNSVQAQVSETRKDTELPAQPRCKLTLTVGTLNRGSFHARE